MITVILTNSWLEFVTRRYDTNSFDEAVTWLVDDWANGEIKWEAEETTEAFTPDWMKRYGYPNNGIEPEIDRETGIVLYSWFWCNGEDELVVEGRFIKSSPIEDGEWPTMGVG